MKQFFHKIWAAIVEARTEAARARIRQGFWY
jgi:hypothetical protein